MKNIRIFHLKNFHFLVVKFSLALRITTFYWATRPLKANTPNLCHNGEDTYFRQFLVFVFGILKNEL